MLPVISVVGHSGSGKTTILEVLIAELKKRGYRIAVIKHEAHGFQLDIEGKDSWRLLKAGSDAVLLSAPQEIALLQKTDHDRNIEELLSLLKLDYDIVLTEGFKKDKAIKIEVYRKELGKEFLCSPQELFAVITDEPINIGVAQFNRNEINKLSDMIQERLLSQQEEELALFVNNHNIAANPFVKDIIIKTVKAMISTLRGVEEIKSIDLHISGRNK